MARFEAQQDMAWQFGAAMVFAHEPRSGPWSRRWPNGRVPCCTRRFDGLPVTHPGHIDVVYDTIAKAETLEVGVRVLAERGRLVYTGVSTPQRWEWTPIYFKELAIAGSNAFGMEELDGVRQHAIAHYLAAGGRRAPRHHPDADPPLRPDRLVATPSRPSPGRTRAVRSRWRSRPIAPEAVIDD